MNRLLSGLLSERPTGLLSERRNQGEWLLDTLEGLFDFYFVAPAVFQKKKDALNQKLVDAGKKPMLPRGE